VPCLVSLRTEFNTLAPSRDRSSDGSIGDSAHASSSSDHNPDETAKTPFEDADSLNEVHAIDVDADLRKSGWSMTKAVEVIVTRHRTGADNRLQNVIYNRRIWSASWGWTARTYTGSNPHDKHAHFSSRYTTAQEQDTRRWGLLEAEEAAQLPGKTEEDDMATISQTDFNARMDAWWNARLSPSAVDNPQRRALRVAAWQQEVGRSDRSTHDVLFFDMRNQLAAMAVKLSTLPDDVIEALDGVEDPASIAQILTVLLGAEKAAAVGAALVAAGRPGGVVL
jgi:hypothetical protein